MVVSRFALYQASVAALRAAAIPPPQPEREVEEVLCTLLRQERLAFWLEADRPLPPSFPLTRLHKLIARRGAGEPLEYLLHRAWFAGMRWYVRRGVTLIPRPETEELVEQAAALAKRWGQRSLVAADIGTGSGVIGITLACRQPTWQLWGVDPSARALRVARYNAAQKQVGEQITFRQGFYLQPIPPSVPLQLLVANLPYIPAGEIPSLPPSVREHEPHLALDGGPDGLALYRILLGAWQRRSPAPPWGFLCELSPEQGEPMAELLRAYFPAAQVALHADISGRLRVAAAWQDS